jgi:hypothetical protein
MAIPSNREYRVILTVIEDTDVAATEAWIEVGTTVEVVTEDLHHCMGHIAGIRIERIE